MMQQHHLLYPHNHIEQLVCGFKGLGRIEPSLNKFGTPMTQPRDNIPFPT